MDFKIKFSPEAIANLEEITAWIARDSAERAERFGNALIDRVEILRNFPEIGCIYSRDPAIRKLVSPPYFIVYRVIKTERTVEIIAFRHTSRDATR